MSFLRIGGWACERMMGKRLKPARTVIAIKTERIFPHPLLN
jgi:hypothetical protein